MGPDLRSVGLPRTAVLLWRWGVLPLLACLAAGAALADEDHEAARALVEAGEILPLESVLGTAQARYPGRVLEVELAREEGRRVYEIELIDEYGVVLELHFDARTGELLKTERED